MAAGLPVGPARRGFEILERGGLSRLPLTRGLLSSGGQGQGRVSVRSPAQGQPLSGD